MTATSIMAVWWFSLGGLCGLLLGILTSLHAIRQLSYENYLLRQKALVNQNSKNS
jgi:hypothetical protein